MADEQGFPVDLQTGVQRMIDAGESEANIATAIQAYKAQMDPAAARASADARAKAVQTQLEGKANLKSQLTDENVLHDLGQWGSGALSAGKAFLKQAITNPLGIAQPEMPANPRPDISGDMSRLRTLPARAWEAIKDPIGALQSAGVTPDIAAQFGGAVSAGAAAPVIAHGATQVSPAAIGDVAVRTGEGLTSLGESPTYGKLSRAGGAFLGNKVVPGAGGLIGGALMGDAVPAATGGMGRLLTKAGTWMGSERGAGGSPNVKYTPSNEQPVPGYTPPPPEPTGPVPRLVKGGAPTLEEELQSALEQARTEDPDIAGTTAPEPTLTPTGRPSVTPGRYEKITGTSPAPGTTRQINEPTTPQQGVLRTRAAAPTENPHGDVPPEVMDQIRQIAAENDALRFTKRTFNEGGPGRGGDFEIVGGSGGASSLQDVLDAGGYGSRAEIVQAANDVIDGTGRSNLNTQAVIKAAQARLAGEGVAAEPGKGLPPDAHSTYETPREVAQRQRSGFLPRGTAPTPAETPPVSEQLMDLARQEAAKRGVTLDETALREKVSDPQFLQDLIDQHNAESGGDTEFNPAELEGQSSEAELPEPWKAFAGEPGERGMVETPSTASKEPKGQLRDELGARDAQRLLNRTLGQQGTTESLRSETPARATGQTSETSIWPRPRIKAVSDTVREMLANGATDDELRAYINKSPNDMGKRMTTMIINTLAPERSIPMLAGAALGGAALRKALVGQLQQNQEQR